MVYVRLPVTGVRTLDVDTQTTGEELERRAGQAAGLGPGITMAMYAGGRPIRASQTLHAQGLQHGTTVGSSLRQCGGAGGDAAGKDEGASEEDEVRGYDDTIGTGGHLDGGGGTGLDGRRGSDGAPSRSTCLDERRVERAADPAIWSGSSNMSTIERTIGWGIVAG